MRRTSVTYVAGAHARQTTAPPPPWVKRREFAHLQKFKEFKLAEFPFISAQTGFNGRSGSWMWGDAKEMQADRALRESRHEMVEMRRYPHPDLLAEQDRIDVPQAAAAVLASHLRGRPGGYGLAPEHQNVPLLVHSEKPELDTAKKDEPRTARGRWAQYREVELVVGMADLGLSAHAQRRFEAAYGEYIHEGNVHIKSDNFEDFWDNYERSTTQLNIMIADAKKADLHPKYRPMEQYKVRDNAHDAAVDSLKDWYSAQAHSLVLGEKYKKLKEAGAESVTGFNLYETPAYAVFNAERAARTTIKIRLDGAEDGYAVDKMSVAMSTAKAQLLDFEEEEEIPDHLHDRAGDGTGMEEGHEIGGTVASEEESAEFRSQLSSAFAEAQEKEPVAAPAREKPLQGKKPKPAEEEDDFNDLLSDFVNPDDE
eukprot:TRINITY_DN32743_c0_g1_i1.p1 TRINITY_DN32743_c0_g1~~TRINITY_DN32743_c0_g1_i1.p1  ORF type:complete len:425 (+),score=155.53 TRINITY_DN32743_c0_g1_i1:72-1346(+)